MLTNLIENRGKEFSNLLKIGDYLARSLRENVELFHVNEGKATYITESGSVLSGDYSCKPTLRLTNIVVEDSSVLEEQGAFEEVADKKVSLLLADLLENDYSTAENTFDNILSLYETKLSFHRVKARLQEKTARFGESTKIVSSNQFKRAAEIKDHIVTFLKENKDIGNKTSIRNGMKLVTVVANSFNLPKKTIEGLKEEKVFEVVTKGNSSVYEHLCRQELVQKELLETKKMFDNIWMDNSTVHELSEMVFESNEDAIREKVAALVCDAPYFALATKKQIGNLVHNSLSLSEVKITNRDVNAFVSKVYEMKKPVKSHVLGILNEKYGINVKNLRDVPTFRNLILSEGDILTSIANEAPKASIVRKALLELASSLKMKNGAESIDLADFLNEIFTEADYSEVLNETSLTSYLDFNRVADDLGKIGQVLKMIQPLVSGAEGAVPGEGMAPEPEMAPEGPEDPLDEPLDGGDPLGSPDPMESGEEAPSDIMPDAQEVADEVQAEDEGEMGEDEMEDAMPSEEGSDIPPEEEEPEMPENDLAASISNIEAMLQDLVGEEEPEGEEGMEDEDFVEDEDEEEMEDEVEGDEELEDEDFVEEEEEEEEEEEAPRRPDPSRYKN